MICMADRMCRLAPTTGAMHTELADFADLVARFTWQYRRLDLLWKVTEALCPPFIPAAPSAMLEIVKAVRQRCPFKHRCTGPWILHKLITQVPPLSSCLSTAFGKLRHGGRMLSYAWYLGGHLIRNLSGLGNNPGHLV